MNNQNPLQVCLPARKEKNTNRSGRPPITNMIKFGPQPRSLIIAQILNERKSVKDKTKDDVSNSIDESEDPLEVDDSEDNNIIITCSFCSHR